jgi:hypothetical protein
MFQSSCCNLSKILYVEKRHVAVKKVCKKQMKKEEKKEKEIAHVFLQLPPS